MLASALVLFLMACQLPGEAGAQDDPPVDPRVAAAFVAPGEGGNAWYTVKEDGRTVLVYGKPSGGLVAWDRAHQPAIPREIIERYRARREGRNFGLDIPMLRSERRTIRASDPETLRRVSALACDDCSGGRKCPKHPDGPIAKVEHDFEHVAVLAVAAILFIGAAIVVIKGRA